MIGGGLSGTDCAVACPESFREFVLAKRWSSSPQSSKNPAFGMLHALTDGMTMRDVFVQASMELGCSERTAERNLRQIQPIFPAISGLSRHAIPAGYERQFIEAVKELIQSCSTDPQSAQKLLAAEIARQVRLN